MNNSIVRFWDGKKVKLKQKFPIITNRDLNFREGKEREMIVMLGFKLHLSDKEVLNLIISL